MSGAILNDIDPSRKKSLWNHLRTVLLKKQGLIEILPGHPKYEFTEVLRSLLLYHLPAIKPLHQLVPRDYKSHSHLKIDRKRLQNKSLNKSESLDIDEQIHFCIFAPKVFATLRGALGMSYQSFINSASPPLDENRGNSNCNYLEYLSNSKGNTDGFFFTSDRRFIFKMENEKSIKIFMGFLEDYLGHFIGSPHSLLVKILGAYSIQIGKQKKWYLIVMQSVFWPTLGISERFDIKGCLKGRYEDPSRMKSNESVLKDQNFKNVHLNLGKERAWFKEQLTRDVEFLRKHGIVDYSLLVGIQTNLLVNGLQKDKHKSKSKNFAHLVSSIKRSSLSFGERPSSGRCRSLSEPSTNALKERTTRRCLQKATGDSCPDEKLNKNSSTLQLPGQKSFSNNDDVAQSPARSFIFQVHQPLETNSRRSPSPSSIFADLTMMLKNGNENSLRNLIKKHSKVGPICDNEAIKISEDDEEPKSGAKKVTTELGPDQPEGGTNECNEMNNFRTVEFPTDLDRIEVVNSCGLNDNRRFSNLSLNDWLYSWPDFNGPENRRLLPDSSNGIHIIDAHGHRFYFGIIDIFTEYGTRQKVARWIKTLLFLSTDHSSAPPDVYAERLIKFLEERMP